MIPHSRWRMAFYSLLVASVSRDRQPTENKNGRWGRRTQGVVLRLTVPWADMKGNPFKKSLQKALLQKSIFGRRRINHFASIQLCRFVTFIVDVQPTLLLRLRFVRFADVRPSL